MIRVRQLQSSSLQEFRPWNFWFLFKHALVSQIIVDIWLSALPWFLQVTSALMCSKHLANSSCLLHSYLISGSSIWTGYFLCTLNLNGLNGLYYFGSKLIFSSKEKLLIANELFTTRFPPCPLMRVKVTFGPLCNSSLIYR